MASTPFKVVSWSPRDPITTNKLNAMVNNDNWLRDNQMRGRYSGNSVNRDVGIRMLGGLALITAGKAPTKSKSVSFGSYFSEACRPIVTTGTVSSAQRKIYVTYDGPGSQAMPTRDGFQVHVYVEAHNKKANNIARNFYVAWHALGF